MGVEIEDLQTSKTPPAFQTIKSLREDNFELKIKLRTADEDHNGIECNYNKKCLHKSQKESQNIRKKLQSYIHEIERVDELITIKDNERKMTISNKID